MSVSARKAVKPARPRIRRKLVRFIVLDPDNPVLPPPDGRRNPHGWRFANKARRLKGLELAKKMQRLRAVGYPADVIAAYFGTTRAAVYQRLYRLRRSRSSRPSDKPRIRSSTS